MKYDAMVSAFFILTIAFSSIKIEAEGSEVCYGKYGCFNNEPPYNNDLTPLPRSPETMTTSFRLFTRKTVNKVGEIFQALNPDSLRSTAFKEENNTVVIIHGFLENGMKAWVTDLATALLTKDDISNVISVDWSFGASALQTYPQAAANTRVVGAQVEELIKWLCQKTSLTGESFHIIGASLGAHVAGFAGRRLRENGIVLRRITGLDPAGPGFSNVDPVLRLDPSDASFVDVIHTDIDGTLGGLGIARESGDVDFYPNGGDNQPQCNTGIYTAIKDVVKGKFKKVLACSHNRAIYLFLHSIKKSQCQLRSYPCESWEEFESGKCTKCKGRCVEMGYNAEKYSDRKGTFYLETSGQEPFCVVDYKVTIYSAFSSRPLFALFSPKVKMQVFGDQISSPVAKITRFTSGIHSFILKSPPLEDMKTLRLWYLGFVSKLFYKVHLVPVEEGYQSFCSRLDISLKSSFSYKSTVAPLEEGLHC